MKNMDEKQKSGFSLVEIMIAVLILSVVALGGAASIYHTGAGIRVQGDNRTALALVNNELEQQVKRARDLSQYINMIDFSVDRPVNGITYQIDISFADIPSSPDATVLAHKEISVSTVLRGELISVSSSVVPPIGIDQGGSDES